MEPKPTKNGVMSEAVPENISTYSTSAFASLATILPDGQPQVTPVWCD